MPALGLLLLTGSITDPIAVNFFGSETWFQFP